MQEPLEIVTASRMQNIVQFRKKNAYLATYICSFSFIAFTFRALGVESPRGGAIMMYIWAIVFYMVVEDIDPSLL